MRISVTDAKRQLSKLVHRAGAGDEIILTFHGQEAARLVPVTSTVGPKARRIFLEAIRAAGVAKATLGPMPPGAKISSMAMPVDRRTRLRHLSGKSWG